MLQVKEAAKRYDLSSLRLCVSAGEALPEDLYRRWRDTFGVETLDGIGTTEILHIFLSNRPGQVRPGATGLPVPGYEALVVDDDGRPVAPGEIGNLRSRATRSWSNTGTALEDAQRCSATISRRRNYYQTPTASSGTAPGDDMREGGGVWVSRGKRENVVGLRRC